MFLSYTCSMREAQQEALNVLKAIYPFNLLDEVEINSCLNHMGLTSVKASQKIYRDGDRSDTLYIVLSGFFQLTKKVGGKNVSIRSFRPGDIFGLEICGDNQRRNGSATCLQDGNLIRIGRQQLNRLESRIKNLDVYLKSLWDSFELSLKVSLPWLHADEMIYYLARRHKIVLFQKLLAPLFVSVIGGSGLLYLFSQYSIHTFSLFLLIAISLLLFSLWFLWVILDWGNDFSIVTNERIAFQEKVILLYDSRLEAPIHSILSVNTETSQIGRIFGFGNVVVRTYAGLIVLPNVEAPMQVAGLIKALLLRDKTDLGQSERIKHNIEELNEVFASRLPAKKKIIPAVEVKQPRKKNKASIQEYLQNILQLRFEKGGAITYRTHWFILLQKTWLPGFLLVLIQSLAFLRIIQVIEMVSTPTFLLFTLIIDAVVGGWWLYQYVDWRNDLYIITDDQVIDIYKKPLGSEERKAAPLRNIQSINFARQGIMRLLLNYGTVYIKVGDNELTFDDVYNPSVVQAEISKRISERDYKQHLAEAEEQSGRMREWIKAYDEYKRSHDEPRGSSRKLN